MTMSTATQRLTYDEWRELPETKQKCEVVDGALVMPLGPDGDHQWIAQEIYAHGREFARSSGLGVFMFAPFDLLISRDPLRVRQPDMMFLNTERNGIRGRNDIRGIRPLEAPPDIVIEVLSPSNPRRELESRLRDYQQIGACQCRVFSPEAETGEIIDLTHPAPRSIALFDVEDTLTSDLLPGFELKLSEVFA